MGETNVKLPSTKNTGERSFGKSTIGKDLRIGRNVTIKSNKKLASTGHKLLPERIECFAPPLPSKHRKIRGIIQR